MSRLLVAAGLVVAVAGCGSDGATESCDDDESPELPKAPESAVLISQIKLESRVKLDADGGREVQNLASAVFVDTSRIKRITRSTDDQRFSMSCSGLTGAPVDQCRPPHTDNCIQVKLEVDGVEITGAAKLTLEKKGTGTFVDADAPDPLFGGGEFKVKVTGKDSDEKYFPSYEQALAPPQPLEVTEPLLDKPVGRRDLEVRWKAGNGHRVEIAVQVERANPGANQDTDKVVCLVRDDGCHTIPVGAFDWLMLGDVAPDDKFKVTITRQRVGLQSLDDETATEIKGASRVEMILPQEP